MIPMNTSVVNLHLRREPRFYASIAGDRMYWQRGTNTATRNYNLLVEAHKDESWGTQEDFIVSNNWQNINGYWLKKQTFGNCDLELRGEFERTGNISSHSFGRGVYDAGGGLERVSGSTG